MIRLAEASLTLSSSSLRSEVGSGGRGFKSRRPDRKTERRREKSRRFALHAIPPLPSGLWKYVNVRRPLANVKLSIYAGTQWAVFELKPRLLARRIAEFLTARWHLGALHGETPDDAFFGRVARTSVARCDEIVDVRFIATVIPFGTDAHTRHVDGTASRSIS